MIPEMEVCQTLSCIAERLAESGRSLTQTSDFEAVVPELIEASKGRINMESSPSDSDLTDVNAIYILIRGSDGRLEGFCSLRHFEFGPDKLARFLLRQYSRLYGGGKEAIELEGNASPISEISGSVVFLSDIFIETTARAKSISGGRDKIDPSDISMISYCIATLRWRPDWLYGFLKDKDNRRGLGPRYFGTRFYPWTVRWKVETERRSDTDWLLCMSRSDMEHVIQTYSPPFS